MARSKIDHALAHGAVRASAKSVAVLREAARAGDAEAQFALGLLYLLGRGVDTDFGEAVRLLSFAVDAKIEDAEYFLDLAGEQLARQRAGNRVHAESIVSDLMDAKRRELFPKPRLVVRDN